MSNVFQDRESSKVGKCLSLEELTKYVNGELTEKEKFSFEQHLVECELCTDAIEGFSYLNNQETLNDVIDTLQNDISSKSGYKPSKGIVLGWKKIIAIAATLIVLTGTGFLVNGLIKNDGSLAWFSQEKDPTLAIEARKSDKDVLNGSSLAESADSDQEDLPEEVDANQKDLEASDNQTPIAQTDREILGEAVRNEGVNDSKQDNGQFQPAESDLTNPSQLKIESPEDELNLAIQSEEEVSPEIVSADDIQDELSVTGATAPDANGDNQSVDRGYVEYMAEKEVSNSNSVTGLSTTKSNLAKKKSETITPMESAMTKYNNTDYKQAIKDFEDVLSNSPNNRKALYHTAVSYMNLGKNNKAIPYFDKLINASGTYTESSQWLKAQILIKKNKTEDARLILQDLANGNGRFSDQAFDLLQKL